MYLVFCAKILEKMLFFQILSLYSWLEAYALISAAQNLILSTNYSGAEPQIEANGGTRQTRGIGSLSRDITNAPAPRSFIASLTIGF